MKYWCVTPQGSDRYYRIHVSICIDDIQIGRTLNNMRSFKVGMFIVQS